MDFSSLWGRPPENYLAIKYIVMDLVSLLPVACGYLWEAPYFRPRRGRPDWLSNCDLGRAYLFRSAYVKTEIVAECSRTRTLSGLSRSRRSRGQAAIRSRCFVWPCLRRASPSGTGACRCGCVCLRIALRRRWIPVLLGASVPAFAGRLIDALTWRYPFQSVWLDIWVSL